MTASVQAPARTTTIVNLSGGPGSGKSTTAAAVFAALKGRGVSCELITEYVKQWAWRGTPIGPWDDIYITAKQLRRESACYGKVDVVVTDSPLWLGAIYERVYRPDSHIMAAMAHELRARQAVAGLRVIECFVKRSKPFVQAGRYESEDQARRVDALCREWLTAHAGSAGYHIVDGVEDVLRVLAAVAP